MNKKIILIICISIISLIAAGCTSTITLDGKKVQIYYGKYAELKLYEDYSGGTLLVYDITTGVMYDIFYSGSRAGISPHYIVIDGEAQIGIYGVNYYDCDN